MRIGVIPSRVPLATVVLGLVLVGAAAAWMVLPRESKVLRTTYLEQDREIRDDRSLVGWADQVLVARIDAELGTWLPEDLAGTPETKFEATVISQLKGNLGPTAKIVQLGGYVNGGLELVLIEGEQLLEVGKTYLLFTRTDKPGRLEGKWIRPSRAIMIESTAHRKQLLQRFSDALANQVASAVPSYESEN